MNAGLLRIENLWKSFDDAGVQHTIFQDFSLQLRSGETLALTGPSGSGKSTLLNIIAGVLPADRGRLCMEGETADAQAFCYGQLPVAATAALRRRRIGYVFQFFNLVPTLTVRENVLLSLRLADRLALLPQALARLDDMGLGHRLDAFPEALSGGEQQRAAIARALAPAPSLILADEPTGNLDADNAAAVVSTLWRAVADSGSALLVATHDAQVAQQAERRVDLAC
ncbi:MAG: ABC transporter ATP-binding protein [Pseudomonadales bacterium]